MPSPSSVRRLLVASGAGLCLVIATVSAVAWRDAEGTRPVRIASVADVSPEVQPAVTSSSTSTTTSAPTTTSTSTAVTRRPVTTTSPPRTTVRAPAPPAPVAATVPAAAPAGPSAEERCATARQWVEAHGLVLPAGWGFRCPGKAVVDGADRWGVACWNCEGAGSWIAVDVGRIGASEAALRYVIAHETCHAIDDAGLGITTELGADLCAALHGAPRPA